MITHSFWEEQKYKLETHYSELVQEKTWTCKYCGRPVAPKEIRDPNTDELILLVPAEQHGCAGETAHLEAQAAELAKTELATVRAWVGLSPKLATCTFNSYKTNTPDRNRQKAVMWSFVHGLIEKQLDGHNWVVMCGPCGTGKTHLAAAVLNHLVTLGAHKSLFVSWVDYLNRIKASFDPQSPERTGDLRRRLHSAKLLIIDDLDKVKVTDWARETLYDVLNRRYDRNLATVMTCNAQASDLMTLLGAPNFDRFCEVQYAVVEFKGKSYRSGITYD